MSVLFERRTLFKHAQNRQKINLIEDVMQFIVIAFFKFVTFLCYICEHTNISKLAEVAAALKQATIQMTKNMATAIADNHSNFI